MKASRVSFAAALLLTCALPLSATAQTSPGPQGPLRVGGDIKEPRKIADMKPAYPEAAQAAGVQGIVIIEAGIGTDGLVTTAKILRGHDMLNDAAIEAVRQWRYTPTLLNGMPVEVVMTVTVNFSLAGLSAPAQTNENPQGANELRQDAADGVLRIGGNIKEPRKLRNVFPVYPPDALAAKVQGIVILEIVVAADGTVSDAKVLRGQSLLNDAALDAVRQWAFEPTMVDGLAVPVRMTVTVNFTLSDLH